MLLFFFFDAQTIIIIRFILKHYLYLIFSILFMCMHIHLVLFFSSYFFRCFFFLAQTAFIWRSHSCCACMLWSFSTYSVNSKYIALIYIQFFFLDFFSVTLFLSFSLFFFTSCVNTPHTHNRGKRTHADLFVV